MFQFFNLCNFTTKNCKGLFFCILKFVSVFINKTLGMDIKIKEYVFNYTNFDHSKS